ncbi:MAG: Putative adenylate kinase [Candidatus Argoarchaeum ethanivorans]|uniref:Putative adenylate kinase n=1 Tax=Candidatus Argoarchaeum ethanivorans TaxID=2608793 RepID=A0A811TGE7_9EURY|nr:MAG: Putative adenylate kinase [Candidatus Argoarchaeum ethanivorans]
MIIALSGTPGTGKTSTAKLLNDCNIINMNKLIKEHKLYTGVDHKRDTLIADQKEIQKQISHEMRNINRGDSNNTTVIEGHLSHKLENIDAVIVLRCHPSVLKKRLDKRGYSKPKIQENIDAEAIDIILSEAAQVCEQVYEINTTGNTVQQTQEQVEEIIKNIQENKQMPVKYFPGTINWIEEVNSSR